MPYSLYSNNQKIAYIQHTEEEKHLVREKCLLFVQIPNPVEWHEKLKNSDWLF